MIELELLDLEKSHAIKSMILPVIKDAAIFIEDSIQRKTMLIVIGDCRVDYSGRASSRTEWGERLLIIKPDGSLLLHRKMGCDPMNWQPPGSNILVSSSDVLIIRAVRRSPRETLSTYFRKIGFAASFKMTDEAVFEMGLTEAEMYRAIKLKPELIELGFRISSQQKKMKGGKADVTGYDKKGNYVVVEVKKNKANVDSVKQLYKYLVDLQKPSANVRGILASPGIRAPARRLLKTLGLEFVKLEPTMCVAVLSKKQPRTRAVLDNHLN